jgi:probable selenium-dependent hydroxylase accessory protein YqeC
MREMLKPVSQELDIVAGDCVAIVGAGGKTTLMLSLADQLAEVGLRVLVTTSTKIWPPKGMPLVLASSTPDLGAVIGQAFTDAHPICCAGDRIDAAGKLRGLSPASVCELTAARVDVLIVEADGARGRMLKAHGSGEPVVPACSNVLVVVGNLAAHSSLISSGTVHRVEEFCRLTGAASGQRIDSSHFATALVAMAGFAPKGARVEYVLTRPRSAGFSLKAMDVAKNIHAMTGTWPLIAEPGCREATRLAPVGTMLASRPA